ncbi:2Fe-2S iron-sulfur cluster-binding protein [Micavibrio aeruginosavorus]|uniref:Putidaredoxin n=1 Tax=Micavibrio aeruginosavorus (strain ARL-13) TaxID=856793 RepID=G2KR59_MICAA|nr:putidaredoxin [Micavibrio aeruginosavorus ARL-13]
MGMNTYKIHVTNPDGTRTSLDALEGWQVMEILRDYGLPVKAECGGACCCATCHVYVDADWLDKLPPIGDEEECMLDSALAPKANSRLSCQIVMTPELDGLSLTIAPNGV